MVKKYLSTLNKYLLLEATAYKITLVFFPFWLLEFSRIFFHKIPILWKKGGIPLLFKIVL